MLHDAQAYADTLGLAPQFRAAPVEALEDFLLFGNGNAFAVVFDPEEEA